MTALSKAALQALWVQFFQPTQADFANLIDSWTDYSPALEVFGAKVSGGSTGVPNVVSSTSVAFVALGATGSELMQAGTAASARTIIGTVSATETTAGVIEIATQAEANTGTDDTRALTPAKLANISPASVTFDTSDQVLILDASDSNKLKRASVTTGKVLQQVAATSSARATTTNITPIDDTIPQNTEGSEFLTCSITPSDANNILLIEFNGQFETNGAAYTIVALHQDSTANALAAVAEYMISGDEATVTLRHRMTAGTTSSTTFKIRAGTNTGVTLAINSYVGSRVLGGVSSTIMTITEIAA